MTRTKLTNAVRKALAAAPISTNALAREAGVSQSLLARIQSGERAATPAVAEAVARVLEDWGAQCALAARRIRQVQRRSTH